MKTLQFTPAQAKVINSLCEIMMQMNSDEQFNGKHAGTTYNAIQSAVVDFIAIETGLEKAFILNAGGHYGWNLYGNGSFAEDIQIAINSDFESARKEEANNAFDTLCFAFVGEGNHFEIEGQGDPEFYWVHCTLGDLESTIPATLEAAQEFVTTHKA